MLALLGDSILDNWSYTEPEPDTTAHLTRLLAGGWSVLRLARDGAVMADVAGQLAALQGRPDVAVLSIGGNDATAHLGLLDRRGTSAGELFGELLGIADEFEQQYYRAAELVADSAGRAVLCTIYEVQLEPPLYARLARVPLAVLNDRITRVARKLGLEVLELRDVCTEPADFTLQIEPSAAGAAKIARAIAAQVQGTGS
jgi:lysophospholipase L1-like esterase